MLSVFANTWVFLPAVVLLALVVRLAVVSFVIYGASPSTVNFGWESWEMGWVARCIYLGQGFSSPFAPITGPTAIVPPLYPYLMAGAFRLFGLYSIGAATALLTFNSLCSSLTCVTLYFLVRPSLGRRLARFVPIAWAVYPFAIYFAADRLWDYALTSLLFTCCLLVAQKLPTRGMAAWTAFGLLCGITVLSNPSVVLVLLLVSLFALHKTFRSNRTWLPKALLATLTFVAVCAPWTIRNEKVMHASFFIRDGFWLEFYAGNNGDTLASNSAWVHPGSNPVELDKYKSLGEIAYMAQKHDLSIDFVKHHPVFVAIASVRRVVRFWTGFWSFSPQYLKFEPLDVPNFFFCTAVSVFMFRGLRRWWKRDRNAAMPYLLAVSFFPVAYYLTHSSMDYRQPIEPVVVVLVVVGMFGFNGREEAESSKMEDALPVDVSELDAVTV